MRKANLSDLPALLELERLCFPSDRFSSRQCRYLITRANAGVVVYERNGRVVASAIVLFRKNSRRAHLYNVSVHPHAQRQGIGQMLLEWAMRKARSKGCTEMVLEVKVRNRPAMALYEKFKFKPIRRLPKFYENGSDAYRMIASVSLRPL